MLAPARRPGVRARTAEISLLALLLSLVFSSVAPAAQVAGSLDTSFDADGSVSTDFDQTGHERANAVAVQADGNIVAAGYKKSNPTAPIFPYFHDFALARYKPDGSLDRSFGGDGTVETDFLHGNIDIAHAVALQDDGKILAAGRTGGALQDDINFGLVRYNRDGSLDTSFGNGGKVTTDFGGQDEPYAVAVQDDDKIVVGGKAETVDFGLARYNSDGSLDTSFGDGGKVATPIGAFGSRVRALGLQGDGKIVAVGTAEMSDFDRFALTRYNPDGTLDTSFGAKGLVVESEQGGANAAVFRDDGKIVAVGGGQGGSYLIGYNPDGSRDTSFGAGGKVTTDFPGFAAAAALQSDGKILAAGNPSLVRYNPDGSLDTSFGAGGKATTVFVASAVALQADGKAVTAGWVQTRATGEDFALSRYHGVTLNAPPVADNDSYVQWGSDTALNVAATDGVLNGDTDADGDGLKAVKWSEPEHGSLTLNEDGSFSYQRTGDYAGTDSFTYKAFDGIDYSDAATVTITGGAGCNGKQATITGTATGERLTGTPGADVIAGLGGNDTILGQGGNDVVCGGSGKDALNANSGNDYGDGGSGDDSVRGDIGDDTLFGGTGADSVLGDDGEDSLSGGAGEPDSCQGGKGTDSADSTCERKSGIP